MKNLLFTISILIFSFLYSNQLHAQGIEITDEMMYLRNKNSLSTMYWYPDGNVVLAGSGSNLFHLVLSSASNRGLVVSNNWSVPYAFEVYGNGTVKVNGVAVHSDSTLKENIITLDSQIDKIKKIKGVSYKLKGDKETKKDKRTYGLLAQDLEKVYPDMVFTDENGYKSIYYMELIPVLLEVTQEQQTQIEDLQKRLEALEKKVRK